MRTELPAPPTRVAGWIRVCLAMFAVGWGANQFPPLLLVYRDELGVQASTGDLLFGAYALGLIPALLVGGAVSDRYGRAIVKPCAALSLIATGALIVGSSGGLAWLTVGRVLAGVVSGLVFAAGTAWVKELSAPPWDLRATEQSGARRAAIALSAGFGLGPVATGLLAQFVAAPMIVSYVPHLVVLTCALVLLWRVPETAPRDTSRRTSLVAALSLRAAASARFLRVVAPMAPWVFIAPSIAAVVLPAALESAAPGYDLVLAGLLSGVPLLVGVAVQPFGRRLGKGSGGQRGLAAAAGLLFAAAGAGLAAGAMATDSVVLGCLAGAALGCAYGLCLVAGLVDVERMAPPGQLGRVTAAYYALTYLGFACPYVLSSLSRFASYPTLLAGTALLAAATCGLVLSQARRSAAT